LKLCKHGGFPAVSVAKDEKISGGENAVLVGSHLFEEICPEVAFLIGRCRRREILGGGEGSP
jgi:hypothetical protein